ncbi:DUF3592 domain-containing protein [Pseudonocardia sp. GCM10023141]|uniref:DUF3592 domain-containing protein n=1 Tax=Pseudonocardia sp. GCM10023141 TaxID=3252653 RepID=UPI003618EF8B
MSTGTRAIDELAVLVRPPAAAIKRTLPEILVGLAVLVTALAVFALAGAVVDDVTISGNRAEAPAQVLDGSTFARTLVQFTLPDGETRVPELGVFYPRGLEPGQVITVEYDAADPDIVRVAGRSALEGVLPLGLGVLGTWVVLGPLALWLRRRRSAALG